MTKLPTVRTTSDRADYIKGITGFPPPDGSRSLEILFKGERETVLIDKAEYAAERVFNNYCEPDWHQLVKEILGAVSVEMQMKPALATKESLINTGVTWWARLGLNRSHSGSGYCEYTSNIQLKSDLCGDKPQ